MDIDRLNPIPDARPAGGNIADLLTRLRAAGSVEAEVVRVLKDQLLLRSELGEILTRNRPGLRAGDRIRIRLAGTDTNPVLRASPAPQRPATISLTELPRLARSLPADRPVLAEILRVLPQATRIRHAGQVHTLPLRIETDGRALLVVERRPATRTIELQPLDRASIYRALLRHLLPRQATGDADSVVRLLESARPRPTPAAPPPHGSAARGPAGAALTGAAPLPPATATKPVKPPASPIDSSPRPATPDSAARADATPRQSRYPSPSPPPRAYPPPAAEPQPARPAVPVAGSNASRAVPPPRAPAPTAASAPSAAAMSAAMSAQRSPASMPAPAPTGVPPNRGDPNRRGIDSPPVSSVAGSRAPDTAANAAMPVIPAPLARLLDWLPRSAELDAPRLRHWVELLGFARPPATDGARAPDLIDWLRQLRSFDTSARDTAASAPRTRRGAPANADSQVVASDNREAPALPRELLKLAEQALTQNLLQRAAAGLQQETQQPLNLSLTLPFADDAGVRPLRLEFEQRGRRGAAGGGPAWEVRVSFEFGALGPITCHLVLAGRALAASFYCQSDATRERVASALPDLRRQLDAAGFDPGELQSFVGQPRAPDPAAALASEFLIDLEA